MRKFTSHLKPAYFFPRLYIALIVVAVLSVATQKAFMQKSSPPGETPPPATAEKAGETLPTRPGGGKGEQPPESKQDPMIPQVINNAANYAFSTATDASLTDMSSGTTQLLAANIDDTASALTNIGFDFYFQSARFTQFSINDNGVVRLGATAQTSTPYQPLAQTNIPIITPYGGDQRTHAGDGKVHFKVTGSAPNQVLIIEWLNIQSNFNTGGTADLTYQVRLFESTGVIEFVYGSMTMSTAGAADTNSNDPHIGFSSTNTAGNVGSVTAPRDGLTTPTFNGASNDPVENLYNVAGAIPVLTSAMDGARRRFTFTPPTPTAPTGLNFTGVTQLAMTLNWTDSPDETIYGVYRSTDGTNFVFDGTAAANATSYNATSLAPGTTYFWRVFAISEGALSTALAGSQATTPAGNINSTATGGNWSAPATWVGGVVPGAGDNATIVTGATVTIDSSNCLTLTVQTGATLEYEATTARTLTVGQSVTVNNGGIIRSAATGTQTGHVLSVGGDLTNNGTIDFSTNGNTAGAGITFTGATDAAFTLGAGSTTDLKQTAGVTLNKGTNNTPVLTFNPGGTLTVLGANAVGFLTITSGTFKIGGTNTFSNPLFNVAAYSIPAAGGLWMDNPNATVVGLNGSPTVTGRFRMTQGTYNIGTSTGNSMGFAAGSNITVEGGAINATGRFGVAASGNAITYNQTAGTITVCTIGNASTTLASFDLGTGTGTVNITGGTIIVQLANTGGSGPRDYRNQQGLTGTTTVTGGTVQLGNAASGAAKAFSIAGVFPNLVITNTSANHSATFLAPAVFNNITRNITINTGTTLNIGNNVFLMNGTTLTNNGTLTANGASSNFVWFLTTAPQTYTGTGNVTAPVTNFAIQADMGLTIDPAVSNIVVTAIRLFSGSLINSNKITLGNGGTTTGTVQIGNTTTATAAGTFDVPFTFNLGTGGQVMSYLRTTAARTTGPEINPTRTLTSMTYDDNDATHNLTISGGDLTLSSTATALTMTNGRIITGVNNLILSSGTGAVTRTNGYVDGNLRKTYAAAANKNFEVGTANGFSPVAVNVTAGTFPATFTAKAVQGAHPNMLSPTHALQRYWVLTGTGLTADLTFTYLDPTDIPGTATESLFVIFKFDGTFTMPGGTVNTAANTATITGVTSFSDWTLAEPGAPTDVHLLSFTADRFGAQTNSPNGGVLLRWQTGFEVANLGFNIYREEGGKRTLVNPGLVAGSALFVGAGTALGAGRSYAWVDNLAQGDGGQYWLEEFDVNGTSRWHGPVFASASGSGRSISLSNLRQSPLISQLGQGGAHESRSAPVERTAKIADLTAARASQQGSLASQSAVKLSVRQEGWYRVAQPELVAAGLDPRTDARLLQLFVDGQEQAINVAGAIDGEFGSGAAIEFYGVGLDTPSTDTRTYWLVAGTTPGKRIQQVKEKGVPAAAASFPYTVERRDKLIYFASLRNGDKENFFGPVVTSNSATQSLTVSRLDQAGGQAQLEVRLQGVTTAPHLVRVQLNGSNVGVVSFDGQAEGTGRFSVAPSSLKDGENLVVLTSQGASNDISLVSAVRLTYPHSFAADNNALRLTAQGNQALTISGFTAGQIRVVDVSNTAAAQELIGQVNQDKGGYSITVTPAGAGARQLLAFVDEGRRPALVETDLPSSWRQAANGADLVILTRRELMPALEPLKTLRQSQGLKVSIINVVDIYDEFSFGQKSPQALKDFLSFAASSWKIAPRYALFAGDASLDPRNYLGQGDFDLVPTRLIDTAHMETGSDDSMADFNNDGLAEMAIGRLPIRSIADASAMVSKIIAYESSSESEGVLLVSDIGDTYDFEDASTRLRALIPPDVRVERIDRGRMDAAEARANLIEILNRGPKVVNYTGHGSVDLWRGSLLTAEDVLELTNERNLPLFITMTCLNGYNLDPTLDSLAEALLKAERGGAVAVWASSGMTLPDGQALMNQEMYRNIFTGRPTTLGVATAKAKAAVADLDVRRTWILFGDPTTRLK